VSKRLFAVVSVAILLGVALSLQGGPAAHAQAPPAVTFDWVTVGDPGNACDPVGSGNCFGAVGYTYRIATHEVTNAQYAAFLNAKAGSDPLALFNTDMATLGGITRSGTPGSYTYSAVPGRENMPVNNVSFFDALRFANWLHNGQGDGNTETGAYTLLGGTPTPSNPMVERNATARFFLPTDPEWYKAAPSPGSIRRRASSTRVAASRASRDSRPARRTASAARAAAGWLRPRHLQDPGSMHSGAEWS